MKKQYLYVGFWAKVNSGKWKFYRYKMDKKATKKDIVYADDIAITLGM